jgi:hypothetical protein
MDILFPRQAPRFSIMIIMFRHIPRLHLACNQTRSSPSAWTDSAQNDLATLYCCAQQLCSLRRRGQLEAAIPRHLCIISHVLRSLCFRRDGKDEENGTNGETGANSNQACISYGLYGTNIPLKATRSIVDMRRCHGFCLVGTLIIPSSTCALGEDEAL